MAARHKSILLGIVVVLAIAAIASLGGFGPNCIAGVYCVGR